MKRSKTLSWIVTLAMVVSLIGTVAWAAEESSSSGTDVDAEVTLEARVQELMDAVDAAEGASDAVKTRLRERIERLYQEMLQEGADTTDEMRTLLYQLAEDNTEYANVVAAVEVALDSGYTAQDITSVLVELEAGTEVVTDGEVLQALVDAVRSGEIGTEDMAQVLEVLQTEPTPEMTRGEMVSTAAHIRDLIRKAEQDGVELDEGQIRAMIMEAYGSQFAEADLEVITDAILTSDRGMSKVSHAVKASIKEGMGQEAKENKDRGHGRGDKAKESEPAEEEDAQDSESEEPGAEQPAEESGAEESETDTEESDDEANVSVEVKAELEVKTSNKGHGNGGKKK